MTKRPFYHDFARLDRQADEINKVVGPPDQPRTPVRGPDPGHPERMMKRNLRHLAATGIVTLIMVAAVLIREVLTN